MLASLDIDPVHTPEGYVCRLCRDHPDKPENGGVNAARFQTRAELWEDHLFRPLMNWVNNELANARWLRLLGNCNGSTAAELIYDELPHSQKMDMETALVKLHTHDVEQ